ncbi:PAS domain S-box protein [candidate division KSB1 bacterium]|nr:PAS domain S-box protein [candidate division KSB1 bacterium]
MKHKTLAITEAGTLAPYLHDYFDLSQAHSVSLKDEFAHNHVQQFIDIAGVMFLLLNTKAEIKLINRKGCEILGYKQEEILGINWIDTFVPEEQRAATQNVFRQIMHKELESVEYHENPVLTKDGKIRIIAWHNTILCDEQDEIIGTLSSGEDITDRKKAEADLLKRDEKMHSLLQLAQSLQQARSFDQVVQALLKEIRKVVGYKTAWIYLVDNKLEHVQLLTAAGNRENQLRQWANKFKIKGDDYLQQVIASKTPIVMEDAASDPRPNKNVVSQLQSRTIVTIPVFMANAQLGTIATGSFAEEGVHVPTKSELEYLEAMARHVSSVIERIRAQEERQRFIDKLHESKERYRNLIEDSPNAIIVHREGRIIYANPASVKLVRAQNVEQLINLEVMNFVHPDYHKQVFERVKNIYSQTEPAPPMEEKFIRLDGSIIDVEVTGKIVIFEGKPASQVIIQDITARKFAEKSRQESDERYRLLVEQMPDGVYRSTPDGKFLEVNTALVKMLGYTNKEELLAMDIKKDLYFEISERNRALHALQKSGKEEIEVFRLRHKTGREVWVEEHGRVIQDESGKTIFHEGVLRDVTERRKAEREKEKLEAQVRRSQKLETIGTLAGGIAHDFNNILTPILGYADMALCNLTQPEQLHQDLLQIVKGANRAKKLVNQILTFSRQKEQERKPIYLPSVVKEALLLLRPSIPPFIEIQQNIDHTCDQVFADATQIHQIILNLCTNAFHAMEHSGGILNVELTQVQVSPSLVRMHSNLKAMDYVKLTLSDTGTGIQNTILDRIFEPFFTTKSTDKGTGLGLSVVHGIVKAHDGEILVQSTAGQGTTFQIYLPVMQNKLQSHSSHKDNIQTGTESILFIDDEDAVLDVVNRMLTKLGYSVTISNSSRNALKVFQQNPAKFDLVITDLTMPDLNGIELAKRIHNGRPDFPIILITGFGEDLNRDLLNNCGIKAVVGKPLMISDLAQLIREALTK